MNPSGTSHRAGHPDCAAGPTDTVPEAPLWAVVELGRGWKSVERVVLFTDLAELDAYRVSAEACHVLLHIEQVTLPKGGTP